MDVGVWALEVSGVGGKKGLTWSRESVCVRERHCDVRGMRDGEEQAVGIVSWVDSCGCFLGGVRTRAQISWARVGGCWVLSVDAEGCAFKGRCGAITRGAGEFRSGESVSEVSPGAEAGCKSERFQGSVVGDVVHGAGGRWSVVITDMAAGAGDHRYSGIERIEPVRRCTGDWGRELLARRGH
ncbi:hypothetical protein Tco_0748702 [Tanacetum coccineum]|uniref:Uncharacterized protein n=1 Tax=Tanacetum coccineum TaxID=301880 RepID=A0ABQ4YXB6_9ASTR